MNMRSLGRLLMGGGVHPPAESEPCITQVLQEREQLLKDADAAADSATQMNNHLAESIRQAKQKYIDVSQKGDSVRDSVGDMLQHMRGKGTT